MSFHKKTIRDIDLSGKRVVVRVDYNVPIAEDGTISDDYRIKKSLPTLQYLLQQKCRLILISHLGRPKSDSDAACSLRPCAERLGQLLSQEVGFMDSCIGEATKKAALKMSEGDIMLLENLRYHPEEEANDDAFAAQLAELGEVFVQDGFGVVHRAHASTDAITRHIKSVAGLLLEHEVDTITNVMQKPKRPLMAIIGGAKISDKIDILNRLIDVADVVAVGGAMANTFLAAEGIDIGKSMAEPDDVPIAKDIIKKARQKSSEGGFIFYVPQDGVVAKAIDRSEPTRIADWSAHVIASIENYPKIPPMSSTKVHPDELILDIGPFSGSFIVGAMQLSQTVIWNGAMGVTETKGMNGPIGPYAHGTELIIEGLLGHFGHKPFSVLGGGDTVGYIEDRHLTDSFNHVSTGGGASMELMSGKKLPGVEALLSKDKK